MKTILLPLLLVLALQPAWAGIALNGTRLIFDGSDKEAPIIVSNQGEDILVQSWLEPAEATGRAAVRGDAAAGTRRPSSNNCCACSMLALARPRIRKPCSG